MRQLQPVKTVSQAIRRTVNRGNELPFILKDSKTTINLNPEKFRHSIEFSKIMDRAHKHAMNDKIGYCV